jgi:hypothetical protein
METMYDPEVDDPKPPPRPSRFSIAALLIGAIAAAAFGWANMQKWSTHDVWSSEEQAMLIDGYAQGWPVPVHQRILRIMGNNQTLHYSTRAIAVNAGIALFGIYVAYTLMLGIVNAFRPPPPIRRHSDDEFEVI